MGKIWSALAPSDKSKELLWETVVVVVLSAVAFWLAHNMAPMPNVPAATATAVTAPTDGSALKLVLATLAVPVLLFAVLLGRKIVFRAGPVELGVDDPLPQSIPELGKDAGVPTIKPADLLGGGAPGTVDPAMIRAHAFTPGVLEFEVGACPLDRTQIREALEGFGSHGLRGVLFTKAGKYAGQMSPFQLHRLTSDAGTDAARFFAVLSGKESGRLQHPKLVTAALREGATLGEALRYLTRNEVRTGIVVDDDGTPVKALDQDVLHSHLLAGVARS